MGVLDDVRVHVQKSGSRFWSEESAVTVFRVSAHSDRHHDSSADARACGDSPLVSEVLADGRPVQLSTSWEPYDLTGGTLVVPPEGGPQAGAGVVNRMAKIGVTVSHAVEQPEPRQATAEGASLLGIQKAALVTHIRRTYYSDQGRPVETADIVVPAALCEIVYEIPSQR
ncbi:MULTISPECIES: UTRA domain-containing protein [unclassified Streptomyces]|uniref:UTRA domain-containing protein n=1 Tax=unclassified Streptomyces TaxID=2593676 RepID=UPI0036471561